MFRRHTFVAALLALLALGLLAGVAAAEPPTPSKSPPDPGAAPASQAPPVFGSGGAEGATPRDFGEYTSSKDSWIASGLRYQNANYGSSTTLFVGYDGTGPQAERSLFAWNIDSLPPGTIVRDSAIRLTLASSQGSSSMRIVVRRITSDWGEYSVTWNNPPSYDNGTDWASPSIGTSPGTYDWDVSALVRQWVGADLPNYGVIMIGDETPTSGINDRGFWSREAGNSSDRPKLRMNYTVAQVNPFPGSVTGTSFNVSWTSNGSDDLVDRWDVQYRVKPSGASDFGSWTSWLNGVKQTSATFTNAQNGSTYAFRVRAVYKTTGSTTWSQESNWVTVQAVAPPAVVMNPLPPYSGTTFIVSWYPIGSTSNLANYQLETYDNGGLLRTDTTTATSQQFTNGLNGHQYSFRVRSVGFDAQVGPWSDPAATVVDTEPPTASMNPLPPFSGASFVVSWTGQDAISGIQSYNFEAYDNGLLLTHFNTTANSWQFSGGVDGHTYAFRVRAIDNAGNISDWTPTVQTTVETSTPTMVVSVPYRYQLGTDIRVSWQATNATSGVKGYDIQVKDGAGTWTDWLTNTTLTSAIYPGIIGHTYSFRGRATTNAGSTSDYSPDNAAVVTIVASAVRGQVRGNLDQGIPGAALSSTPANLNTGATSYGKGDYALGWATVEAHTINAYPVGTLLNLYLPFAPMTVPAASGVTDGVNIYLRPANDVVVNGGFEQGAGGWTISGNVDTDAPGYSGQKAARLSLGGSLGQSVRIPLEPSPSILAFLYRVDTGSTGTLTVTLDNISPPHAPVTYSLPLTGGSAWQHASFNLADLAGSQVTMTFALSPDASGTAVTVDQVNLGAAQPTLSFTYMPLIAQAATPPTPSGSAARVADLDRRAPSAPRVEVLPSAIDLSASAR
ncbi:MAG: DNRLRE domain-containing protein [Anaerolineae bacterium]